MQMKLRVALSMAFLAIATPQARGQATSCPPGTGALDQNRITQDACQMAFDVFQFVAPQLGIAITGGNATLGQGGALGGLGHFSLGLRANLLAGDLPEVQNFPQPSTGGRVQHNLPTKKQFVGLPAVDAALGIFKGLPLGLTNVGGVDLLLSASYIPTYGSSGDAVQVKPDQSLQFGIGARLGLLQESLLVPGVSVTYLRRDLPTTTIIGTSSNVNVNVSDAKVKTNAWRLTASKSLILFNIAAGIGQDHYDQSALVQGSVRTSPTTTVPSQQIKLDQSMTRTNYFLDATMNLLLAKIVGEIGQVSGGTVNTYNTFSGGRADKSRLYGSVGVRLGF
jgi:hypothetical protein